MYVNQDNYVQRKQINDFSFFKRTRSDVLYYIFHEKHL